MLEDLSRFTTQLREVSPHHVAEDLARLRDGTLDLHSLANGYRPWRDAVRVELRDADGTLLALRYDHNLRTNAGGDWQAQQMAGTPGTAALYMALAIDATAVANTDSFLGGTGGNQNTEIATGGLQRKAAIYAHSPITTTGSTSITNPGIYTLTAQWSCQPGYSFTGVNKCGVWTAVSGGILVFQNPFSPVNLNPGDTLTIVYQVSY